MMLLFSSANDDWKNQSILRVSTRNARLTHKHRGGNLKRRHTFSQAHTVWLYFAQLQPTQICISTHTHTHIYTTHTRIDTIEIPGQTTSSLFNCYILHKKAQLVTKTGKILFPYWPDIFTPMLPRPGCYTLPDMMDADGTWWWSHSPPPLNYSNFFSFNGLFSCCCCCCWFRR